MRKVTGNGAAHPESPAKEYHHVPHLDPEPFDPHGYSGSSFRRPAVASTRDLPATARGLPRSAGQRRCGTCLGGADLAAALACSGNRIEPIPPEDGAASAWERREQQLNQDLDRNLSICRGC
jgi:hypothetical protein